MYFMHFWSSANWKKLRNLKITFLRWTRGTRSRGQRSLVSFMSIKVLKYSLVVLFISLQWWYKWLWFRTVCRPARSINPDICTDCWKTCSKFLILRFVKELVQSHCGLIPIGNVLYARNRSRITLFRHKSRRLRPLSRGNSIFISINLT